jgi:hypothetical protein
MNLGGINPIEPITEDLTYTRNKRKEKGHPIKSSLPADLLREVTEIAPEEDTKGMKLIGHAITEQFEMTPARFYLKQYKRAKYARPEGNRQTQLFLSPAYIQNDETHMKALSALQLFTPNSELASSIMLTHKNGYWICCISYLLTKQITSTI